VQPPLSSPLSDGRERYPYEDSAADRSVSHATPITPSLIWAQKEFHCKPLRETNALPAMPNRIARTAVQSSLCAVLVGRGGLTTALQHQREQYLLDGVELRIASPKARIAYSSLR
jgi:hypothetical protein